ncbi:hypothetical protein V6N13_041230 [Hibiscus sabdariffa]|uniref:Uncharacterized protein n=1 Tax=Hibiscus sabdariffa TaxID=183260 RepID=A0ABR2RB26_9ROSI
MTGNPNVTGDRKIYENPGGRPPEGIRQIGGLSVLERDSSPVDPEDQRLAKKGRNEVGSKENFSDSGDLKDMDTVYEEVTGVIRGEFEGVPNATKTSDLNDPNRVAPAVSYAAVLQDDAPADSPILVPSDVVVAEEGSGRGLDLGDRNEVPGLRVVEQLPRITKNTTYLESNPTRKQRKDMDGKSVGSKVVVVPLQVESRLEVVAPRVLQGPGKHSAVSIVEPGITSRNGTRVRGGFNGSSGSRVGKENVFKGLRNRKNVDSKDHDTIVLSDWVHQGVTHGVVDLMEDDQGDVLMHEQPNDLVVLGSSVDAVLSKGGRC